MERKDVVAQVVAMEAGLGVQDDGLGILGGGDQLSPGVGRQAVVVMGAAAEGVNLGVIVSLATLLTSRKMHRGLPGLLGAPYVGLHIGKPSQP